MMVGEPGGWGLAVGAMAVERTAIGGYVAMDRAGAVRRVADAEGPDQDAAVRALGEIEAYANALKALVTRETLRLVHGQKPGPTSSVAKVALSVLRVDGENVTSAPIERILLRHPAVSRAAVYAVPDERVGDQIMAALVPHDGGDLHPAEFSAFLAGQSDLSPKCWPRYVRVAAAVPTTATHKTLKRELVAEGPVAGDGRLWIREPRGTAYWEATSSEAPWPRAT